MKTEIKLLERLAQDMRAASFAQRLSTQTVKNWARAIDIIVAAIKEKEK